MTDRRPVLNRALVRLSAIAILITSAACSSGDRTKEAPNGPVNTSPMAMIQAGCFKMGDSFSEGDADELPVHNVCLSAFMMDVREATNGEYKGCMDAGRCTAPRDLSSYTRDAYYGNPVYESYPVIHVTWDDAHDYCTWAGKRLPTEAEWEYAARGGVAGRRYPWGDAVSGSNANYWNSGDPEGNDTNAVGRYPANGYGLYDMAGNVWEWVNDWYDSDYYASSPPDNPQGPANGTSRVVRGGSWTSDPGFLRSANRVRYSRTYQYYSVGIRCAR